MRCLRNIIFVFFAFFLVSGSFVAQETPFSDTQLYKAVLSRLFGYEMPKQGKGSLQLRYTHCESGEMQIEVRELKSGQLLLDVWRLPAGAATVWHQLATLSDKKAELTAEEAAASITVMHDSRVVEKSGVLGKIIMSGRSLQLPLVGDDGMFLEGSQYELTIASLSRDISITLMGPQQPASSSCPIIRWMGRVREQIDGGPQRKAKNSL